MDCRRYFTGPQFEVLRHFRPNVELKVRGKRPAETPRLDRKVILPRRQLCDCVFARVIGRCSTNGASTFVKGGGRSARYHLSLLVRYAASDITCSYLGEGRNNQEKD